MDTVLNVNVLLGYDTDGNLLKTCLY